MTSDQFDDGPLRRPTRRRVMGGAAMGAMAALLPGVRMAVAQDDGAGGDAGTDADPAGTPFDFEQLVARMRDSAAGPYSPPATVGGAAANLDYDDYRMIQFRRDHARWSDPNARVVLQAYHPGWLFDHVVQLNEVVDGLARPITFSRADFEYLGDAADHFPPDADFPGVAGFRLNAPINTPDRFDEVVSFLGASYFRALGQGNIYGLSARGLAVNTAIGREEEFPNFTEFWIERPMPGSDHVVFHAALESPSVAGALRFALTPGETTTIDVEQHLFLREDVRQLGIAPLTSMFLFAPNDRGPFNDYRGRVHDSEALVLRMGDEELYRPLRNPTDLANSYIGTANPRSFGLVQRDRDFGSYLDAGANYERRPSAVVEPLGDWGRGTVRLIEIPTDLESNDNIVAFWVPDGDFSAGDALSFSYRLHWGDTPLRTETDLARILRTLSGFGGVAGIKPRTDRQKFVIDFENTPLTEPEDETTISSEVSATSGQVVQTVLERLDEEGIWRLILEVEADPGVVTELKAVLRKGDRPVSETWLYQWKSV